MEGAAAAYRALVIDPDLVPAIVNLANIHYARDEMIEAQALYERAIGLDPDCFEAYFNLGNIHHDLSRYEDALLLPRRGQAQCRLPDALLPGGYTERPATRPRPSRTGRRIRISRRTASGRIWRGSANRGVGAIQGEQTVGCSGSPLALARWNFEQLHSSREQRAAVRVHVVVTIRWRMRRSL